MTCPIDGQGPYTNHNVVNSTPMVHVYVPSAEAHVFFGTFRTYNYDNDSNTAYKYWAGAWVAKVDSNGDWTPGPVQPLGGTQAAHGANNSNFPVRDIKVAFHSLENMIGVAWTDNDDDLQFVNCQVTGSGNTIGLSWMTVTEISTDAEVVQDICYASGSGTTSRWLIYYTTKASYDLVVQALLCSGFSAASA